jgi:DNA invertase Pin-like site-specific DNA recombinase
MTKIVAYLRTSTDKQDLNNQRLEILEYGRRTQSHIEDFIAISISSAYSGENDHSFRLMPITHSG